MLSAVAVALALSAPAAVRAPAAIGYVVLEGAASGKIIEVLDGSSIIVQVAGSTDLARVRLIGVEERKDNMAFSYLNSNYLGKTVTLEFDDKIPSPENFYWNVMYVYYGKTLINRDILGKGFAKTNESHRAAAMYDNFLDDAANSMVNQIGVWDDGKAMYPYAGTGVNINTATVEQLRGLLMESDSKVVDNIAAYRSENPFDTVSELKFVDGFTRDMYNKVRNSAVVSTNIQTATDRELLTLKNITEKDVAAILDYRNITMFYDVSELATKNLISRPTYDLNFPFIAVTDRPELSYAIPDMVVNINTATAEQLLAVGIPRHQAELIVSAREASAYSYKTLGELVHIPDMAWSDADLDKYADNLRVLTDINTAPHNELLSLFPDGDTGEAENIFRARPFMSASNVQHLISAASYDRIKKYIYASSDTPPKYVNVNTATLDILTGAGLSEESAAAVYRVRGQIYRGEQLRGDYAPLDMHLSLFTNINTATYEEIESLSADLTLGMVGSIVAYREDQPFGSLDEVREFFEKLGSASMFNTIGKYIVVR
jgi:DNA uptake protein ComE-like DNA-binding protein